MFDWSGMFVGLWPTNIPFDRGLQHCSSERTTPIRIIQSWPKNISFPLKMGTSFLRNCTFSTLCNKPCQSFFFFQSGGKIGLLNSFTIDHLTPVCRLLLWETILREEGFSTKVKGQSEQISVEVRGWPERLLLHQRFIAMARLALWYPSFFHISFINSLSRWMSRAGLVCDGSS